MDQSLWLVTQDDLALRIAGLRPGEPPFLPDEDSIREHARRTGIPADRVSAVRRLIDPANLK